MAKNKLIHCLGFIADTDDDLSVTTISLKASNKYSMEVGYDASEDRIYATGERSLAHQCLDSWDPGHGDDYDEEEAAEWRAEGREEIVSALESFFETRDTTVDI